MLNSSRQTNSNKDFSVGSSLTPEQYRNQFSFLRKKRRGGRVEDEGLSIHTACFLQAAVCQAKWAEGQGYSYDIPFMSDEGCPDRKDIETAHDFLVRLFPDYLPPFPTHAGELTWGDDKKVPALQAADVVAWAVRRKAAGFAVQSRVWATAGYPRRESSYR